MEEALSYEKIEDITKLKDAKIRCINCGTFPMKKVYEGCVVCPVCEKQFLESPEENFVRNIYEEHIE